MSFPTVGSGHLSFRQTPGDRRGPNQQPQIPDVAEGGTHPIDSLTSSKAKKNIRLLQLLFRKFLKPILKVSNQ
jgi:hypothetical protein